MRHERWLSLNTSRKPVAAVALLSILALAGCEQGVLSGQIVTTDNVASMSFSTPIQLQDRAIVRDNLTLEITLNGQSTEVASNAAGLFIYETTVSQNTSTEVTLEWSEVVDGIDLTLATARQPLVTGSASTPVVLDFFSSVYNTSMDNDNDGYSNLIERRDGTRYNDDSSPPGSVVFVALEVKLMLPEALQDASADIKAQVSAIAAINDVNLPLTRVGDEWRGFTTAAMNADPLVHAQLFADAEQDIEIARLWRSRNVGSGLTHTFQAGDYDTESLNEDLDALSNVREIANGTDPRDPNDPVVE